MNELMKKIAEKLSVSIDKIPEVYTGLRNQYVVWEACDSMSWIFGIAALCVTFALVFSQILKYVFAPDIVFLKGVLN